MSDLLSVTQYAQATQTPVPPEAVIALGPSAFIAHWMRVLPRSGLLEHPLSPAISTDHSAARL
jgi:hypothetical protein